MRTVFGALIGIAIGVALPATSSPQSSADMATLSATIERQNLMLEQIRDNTAATAQELQILVRLYSTR